VEARHTRFRFIEIDGSLPIGIPDAPISPRMIDVLIDDVLGVRLAVGCEIPHMIFEPQVEGDAVCTSTVHEEATDDPVVLRLDIDFRRDGFSKQDIVTSFYS
jgi:hypothetical protein